MNGSTDAPDATRAAGMEAARAFVDDATVTQRYAHVGSDGDLLLILMADFAAERTAALERENAALKRDRGWVPVSERLPDADTAVLVTMQWCEHEPSVTRCAHRAGVWFLCNEGGEESGYLLRSEKVVAWMPLPEPYDIARAALPDAKGGEGE
jgi:hypothetical protein